VPLAIDVSARVRTSTIGVVLACEQAYATGSVDAASASGALVVLVTIHGARATRKVAAADAPILAIGIVLAGPADEGRLVPDILPRAPARQQQGDRQGGQKPPGGRTLQM
jgi:hypothetical protein